MTMLSPEELKNRYDISYSTQYRWRQNGKLPYIRIGRRIYYEADEIADLAKNGQLNLTAYLAWKKQ